MVVFSAFSRSSLVALALCSAAFAACSSPALARSHHGATRHTHVRHAVHHARRHVHHRSHLATARAPRHERSVTNTRSRRFAAARAGLSSDMATSGFGSSNVIDEARRYIGHGNPTGRARLWCARFMNLVLERTGHRGTGSDMASSFAHYGQRVSGPQVGAIAVMGRRGGGHVGVITGIDAQGNPIMISGNNGNRVREMPVSRGRIYAYVMPN
jgi:uncharacterized protein (TIGR02594 family)